MLSKRDGPSRRNRAHAQSPSSVVGQADGEDQEMRLKMLPLSTGFDVVCTLRNVQAAQMVLPPGERTGGPDNRHIGTDQWLYVVSGTGLAVVEGAQHKLHGGSLLVIERGEAHEIRCIGDEPLRTVNFYSPPAYAETGEPLPAGES